MLAGCSIAARPDALPALREYGKASLTGVSLIVINAEKDPSDHEIRNDSGAKSGIVANRFVWSSMFVEALAGELARRGARVRVNAPLTLGIAVPDITFNQFGTLFQFRVVVAVVSSTGWSRDYEGIAEAHLKAFESRAALVNRLAGEVLAEAVKAMLRDDDFLTHLRSKGEKGAQESIPPSQSPKP